MAGPSVFEPDFAEEGAGARRARVGREAWFRLADQVGYWEGEKRPEAPS